MPTMFHLLLSVLCIAFSISHAYGHEFRIKQCFNVSIPVTVTSTNLIWGAPRFSSNLDVTAFNTQFNRRDFATAFNPISGTENKTASYKIGGTFCKPSYGSGSTLIVASHGGTFDRYYWDSRYQPSNYSFVDFATVKGYSVFYYDRLGVGESDIITGYVNQMPIQVAILEHLVQYAKSGSFSAGSHSKYTPKKIVLMGHSLGSIISNALIASNPTIADAAVLTGWGFNTGLPNAFGLTIATWQIKIANTLSPKFKAFDTGCLIFNDIYSYINTFFKVPFFDMGAAQYGVDSSWPASIMELMSIGALNFLAPTVTAPVMFMVGEFDYTMCGGYCPGVLMPAAGSVFSASEGFQAYIQPNTGHVLNFAYNATGGFKVVTDFLSDHGL